MTIEEAINYLQCCAEEAKDKEWGNGIRFALTTLNKTLSAEPCGDAINRDEVLKQINCWIGSGEYKYTNATYYLTRRMQDLPPATPKSKPDFEDCISRKEAIKRIKELFEMGECYSDKYSIIGTINQMPSIQPIAKKNLVVEDAISRQAVLGMQYRIDDSATLSTRDVVNVDDIEDLPPVTPKPKTGHWIEHPHETGENWEYSKYECSECHAWENDDSDFCPNCGAKMESEE